MRLTPPLCFGEGDSTLEMRDPFREPVSLSDPDPAWAQQFSDAAARITLALSGLAPTVEHIGSTSVPVRGKPIIDIQIAVEEDHRLVAISALEELGFSHHGEANVPGRDYLTCRSSAEPAINVHLFNVGNPLLDDNRMVRDYLRANPQVAREYGAVKDKALAEGHDDLASYSHAKEAHVAAIREAAYGRSGAHDDQLRLAPVTGDAPLELIETGVRGPGTSA